MKIKLAGISFLVVMLVSLVITGSAWAQQPTPSDDQVNAIAKQLYCPVCENIPLDVCPTAACEQWRELIRLKLSEGKTEQEIKDYFVAQYGARVLGTPPARGINWLAYLVPPVAIIAGAYVLFRAFRSWNRPQDGFPVETPPDDAPPAVETDSDEYIRQLEDEVRKR